MISWHLALFIGVVIFFIYRIWKSNKENGHSGGYINIDLITPLWAIGLIVITIIYGGIFWW